jgi:type II secretory pathway pseudopilin PulG
MKDAGTGARDEAPRSSSLRSRGALTATFLAAALLSAVAGCRGGGGSAHELPVDDLIAHVPADAIVVSLVGADAEEAERALLWTAGTTSARQEAMRADLDAVTMERLGISFPTIGDAAFWLTDGSDGFAAALLGEYEGTLRTEDRGFPAPVAELDRGVYLAPVEGGLLTGTERDLATAMTARASGAPTLASSADPTAVAMRELLAAGRGPIRIAANLPELLGGALDMAVPGAIAGSLDASMDAVYVRLRFSDPTLANTQAELWGGYRDTLLQEMREQSAAMRAEGSALQAIAAVMGQHNAELLAETVVFSVDGADLVVSLQVDGAALVVMGAGVAAAVAVPAVLRYQNRSRTTEATMNVRRLYDSAVSYYDSDHVLPSGEFLPPQFPASIPRTPAEVPCGTRQEPDRATWAAPTWEALNFAIVGPHYYSYQFDSAGVGVGATFTASAFGDLDCDGILSTFVRVGEVSEGNEIRGGAGLFQRNELE